MAKHRTCTLVISTAALLGFCAAHAHAYEVKTHQRLTCLATKGREQTFQDVLRKAFGKDASLGMTAIRGRPASLLEWMTWGAEDEDSGVRPLNHFHEPLAPDVDHAGLFKGGGYSSIAWMLMPAGAQADKFHPERNTSWNDARQHYLKALTEPTAEERSGFLALAFKSLGAVQHLVQDATVPSHVRNDQHLAIGSWTDYFHLYVERQTELMFPSGTQPFECPDGGGIWANLVPQRPGRSMLRTAHTDPSGNYGLPLANLIDAEVFTQNSVATFASVYTLSFSTSLGVSEFTNVNFFSQDTVPYRDSQTKPFKGYTFPEPQIDPTQVSTGSEGNFYELVRNGEEIVAPLTLEQVDVDGLPLPLSLHDTFDSIPRAYAEKLLPFAVGYSAEVPAYFLRGSVEITPTAPETIRIRNTSDEPLNGRFEIFYDKTDETRASLAGPWQTLSLAAGATSQDLTLPPPPCDAKEPGKYLLVFQGALGLEPGAVIGTEFTTITRLIFCKRGVGTGRLVATGSDGTVLAEEQLSTEGCDDLLTQKTGTTVNVDFFPDSGSVLVSGSIGVGACDLAGQCSVKLGIEKCAGIFLTVGHPPVASLDISWVVRDCTSPCPNQVCTCTSTPLPSPPPLSIIKAPLADGWWILGRPPDLSHSTEIVGPSPPPLHLDVTSMPGEETYYVVAPSYCVIGETNVVSYDINMRGTVYGSSMDHTSGLGWDLTLTDRGWGQGCSVGGTRYVGVPLQVSSPADHAITDFWASSCASGVACGKF